MKTLILALATLTLLSFPSKGVTAPSEVNIKLKGEKYEFYLREATLGDHYQLTRVVDIPYIDSVGFRHTQVDTRLIEGEENRFVVNSLPFFHLDSPVGHFEVSSNLEYRDINYSSLAGLPDEAIRRLNLGENSLDGDLKEWRMRAILSYNTPVFNYKDIGIQGWATVSPRFSTKSDADSRNQVGFHIYSELPFRISPFVDTIRDDSLHHSYSLVGVYFDYPL